MKKIVATIFIFAAFLVTISGAKAQMMGNNATTDDHTAREEAEGKIIWQKLQNKEVSCTNLSDDDFDTLGEYFMGTMVSSSHPAMNQMMVSMMGEAGERQMHIVMGKRLSGCDTSAAFPSQGVGFMPMMQMMGGWSSPLGFNQTNNPMMNFGYSPLSWFGWIFMALFWVLIVVGIIALIRWLLTQTRSREEKSALAILKERYAKGEIDKKEFEERKKDLI